MNDIVEMYRDAVERGGRDRFSCTVPIWELLQEVAQTFGWLPMGASYVAPPKLTVEAPLRHDYRPGGARDVKRVEKEDAAAWASALKSAQNSPHLAAMITARADAMATADGRA